MTSGRMDSAIDATQTGLSTDRNADAVGGVFAFSVIMSLLGATVLRLRRPLARATV